MTEVIKIELIDEIPDKECAWSIAFVLKETPETVGPEENDPTGTTNDYDPDFIAGTQS